MSVFHQFSRRQVIKAAGISMSLPYLETFAAKKAPQKKQRAIFIFSPNGVWLQDWQVQGEGKNYQLTKSLKSLDTHKSDINIVRHLGHEKARANGDGPGDHARSSGTFLTAQQIHKTAGKNLRAGISFDQVLANKLNGLCRFNSLEYSMEAGGIAGECDSGYSCAYVNNISWANSRLPLARESRVRDAFERLFGDPATNLSKRQQAQEKMRETSVLDLVRSESKDLMKHVSKNDRNKISEYQDSIRTIEKGMQGLDQASLDEDFELPDFSRSQKMDYPRKIRLFYDVMTLALQTDQTRVCSLMLGRGGSNLRHGSLGVKEGHHSLSHHKNIPHNIAQLQKIDQFHAENFSYFLSKLKSVREGDSTLLDNSFTLFGSCIRDGNRHDHHDLPLILAGKGGVNIGTGAHKMFPEKTPLSNLFLGMASAMQSSVQKFGDSTEIMDLQSQFKA